MTPVYAPRSSWFWCDLVRSGPQIDIIDEHNVIGTAEFDEVGELRVERDRVLHLWVTVSRYDSVEMWLTDPFGTAHRLGYAVLPDGRLYVEADLTSIPRGPGVFAVVARDVGNASTRRVPIRFLHLERTPS